MGLQPRSSSPAKAKRLQLFATLLMALRALPGGSGGPELLAEDGFGPAHFRCATLLPATERSRLLLQPHYRRPIILRDYAVPRTAYRPR